MAPTVAARRSGGILTAVSKLFPAAVALEQQGYRSVLGRVFEGVTRQLNSNWGKTPGTQLQQNKGQSGSVTLPP